MNIAVIDDQPVIIRGLEQLLPEHDITVAESFKSHQTDAIIEKVERFDLILLDIFWKQNNAFKLLHSLNTEIQSTPLLVFTFSMDVGKMHLAFEAGVKGYISKNDSESTLIEALKKVYNGEEYISPLLATAYTTYLRSLHQDNKMVSNLNKTEIEILYYTSKLYSNRMIAEELYLGVKTIENYKYKISEKIGVKGRGQLTIFAQQYQDILIRALSNYY